MDGIGSELGVFGRVCRFSLGAAERTGISVTLWSR